MKVLVIYHCGLQPEAKVFYQEYLKHGVDLSVIVASKIFFEMNNIPPGNFVYSKEYSDPRYKFLPVDLRKPESYGEGFKFFQLLKAIKEANPDIIHFYDEYSSFQLTQILICRNILYGRRVPVLAYASQNIPFKSPPFIFEFSARFVKRIIRKILHPIIFFYHKKYLDGFTACNSEAIKNIRAMGGNMPSRLTPWGIDLSHFYIKNKEACREKLGVEKNVKLVGNIGRMVKEKGLDKLVKATNMLPGYNLLLPGKGDYKNEIEKIINDFRMENRVHYVLTKRFEELVDYYNCLDVFVLPSQTTPEWKEQYGIVLAEAMACGLPIVGSSSGAIPETLSGYPKHLIFEEDSIEDLTDKIKKAEILTFPPEFNLEKFLYKFSAQKFISDYVEFYKEILSNFIF